MSTIEEVTAGLDAVHQHLNEAREQLKHLGAC